MALSILSSLYLARRLRSSHFAELALLIRFRFANRLTDAPHSSGSLLFSLLTAR